MVAYVGKLVADYSCQLVVVQAVDYARGERHGVALLVYSAGKGVELRVIDDVDFGHVHVAGNAQVFDDVVYPRVFLARDGA